MIITILIPCVRGIIEFLWFYYWLFSPFIISSEFTYVVAFCWISLLLRWNNTLIFVHLVFTLHSSVNNRWLLWIVLQRAWECWHLFETLISVLLDKYSEVIFQVADLLFYWGFCILKSHFPLPQLTMYKGSNFTTFSSSLYWSDLQFTNILSHSFSFCWLFLLLYDFFLSFILSHLTVFAFVACSFSVTVLKSLPNLISWDFPSMLSSRTFIILALTVKAVTQFKLFVWVIKVQIHSSECGHLVISHNLLQFIWNPIEPNWLISVLIYPSTLYSVPLAFMSVFMTVPSCFNLYTFWS